MLGTHEERPRMLPLLRSLKHAASDRSAGGIRAVRRASFRQWHQVDIRLALEILHLGLQCTQLRLRGILLRAQRTDRFLLFRLPVGHLALLRPCNIEVSLQAIRASLLNGDQAVRKALFGLQLGPGGSRYLRVPRCFSQSPHRAFLHANRLES